MHVLRDREPEAASIEIGGRNLVLLQHYARIAISLPWRRVWEVRTHRQWHAASRGLRAELARCGAGVSMSDVILALAPMLARISEHEWLLDFDGDDRGRSTAWMSDGARSPDIFRRALERHD